MTTPERSIIGWDVGGAHVKACLMQRGQVVDVAQWACPLWQGLQHLDAVLAQVAERWPESRQAHAVTMTGEMVDLFADRQDGVQRIATQLATKLAAPVYFFAGDSGWCRLAEVGDHWPQIASANWLASARHAASWADGGRGAGVLIDIGSTTTDLVAFRGGRVRLSPLPARLGPLAASGTASSSSASAQPADGSRSDAQRLASGELVYHGVVRTPLCALGPRIEWRGTTFNVMNEFFATTADVYRLTGELDPAHDLYPSADGAPKDLPATRRRLARMVGLDAREASPADWLAFAQAWRAAQVAEIGGQLRRLLGALELGADVGIVSAGCGAFLVADVLAAARSGTSAEAPSRTATAAASRWPVHAYGGEVARIAAHAPAGRDPVAAWAQVCAPSVAVAALFERDEPDRRERA